MHTPVSNEFFHLPNEISQNTFGSHRKYDIHTGVDIFCPVGTPVYAVEKGIVSNVFPFTGEEAGSPWWNNTSGILISGVHNLLYGEIETTLSAGDEVIEGQVIGKVKGVLKKDKGLPTSMLHFEMYDNRYNGAGVTWKKGDNQPEELLDPTEFLLQIRDANEPFVEYEMISNFYGNRRAKRSGVRLIDHIDQGIKLLREIGASDAAVKAYCLHPVFQENNDLLNLMINPNSALASVKPEIIILAMEYRSVANAYLSCHFKNEDDTIHLSPLKEVNDMLIADKVQNRKDFEKYHLGVHIKSDILKMYFANWLRALNVSETKYNELVKLIEEE